MTITRDALAELAADQEDDRTEDCLRCGRSMRVPWGCQCWTLGDLYVVDAAGLCQPDPDG